MEASSNNLMGKGIANIIRKNRGQSTFKIYYGIMRKATIIDYLQQRRWSKSTIIAEHGKKKELLYSKDPFVLDVKMDNQNSQCEDYFSESSMDNTEIKTSESIEDNFKVGTLSPFHENLQQNQDSAASTNESEPHYISPIQKSNLQKAFHTYEHLGLPRMAIFLPRPRKAAIVTFSQRSGLRNWIMAENETKESMNITGIKAIESTEDNLRISTLTPLQENLQYNQDSPTFSKDSSPGQKSKLYRAFHTYEHLVLPRMAIVLPKPLQGRTKWLDPNKFQISDREQAKSKLIREKLKTILDTLGSFQGLDDSSALQPQISRNSYKTIDLILILLFIILTIFVFYFIWTFPLPEEILLTFSGMCTLLMSYMYYLVNKKRS